jgi:His-Xaa-Ser system protein HxsD
VTVSCTAEFCTEVQELGPLQAAAYRVIGTCVCQIEKRGDRWHCTLTPRPGGSRAKIVDLEILRTQFIDLVTDENLRARIAAKTDGVRNVILALAFGALAATDAGAE